jgi:hypothetical protein
MWQLCTAPAGYPPRCPKQAPVIVARREPTGTVRSRHWPGATGPLADQAMADRGKTTGAMADRGKTDQAGQVPSADPPARYPGGAATLSRHHYGRGPGDGGFRSLRHESPQPCAGAGGQVPGPPVPDPGNAGTARGGTSSPGHLVVFGTTGSRGPAGTRYNQAETASTYREWRVHWGLNSVPGYW